MSSEKKKRSPVERMIVWGLIAAMLVVVVIEYRASTNFNAAQNYLMEVDVKRPTLDEVKSELSGANFSEKRVDKVGTDEYEISFTSLFKANDYKLRIYMMEQSEADGDLAEGDRRVGGHYGLMEVEDVVKEQQNQITDDSSTYQADGDGEHAGGAGPGLRGPGSRGSGGGFGRRRVSRGILGLITNSHVKTQLAVTDEQFKKIKEVATANKLDRAGLRDMEPVARMAAMKEYQTSVENGGREVLEADQFEAVEKMVWVQDGPLAFVRDAVVNRLGLTEDQVTELSKIREGIEFDNPPVDEMMSVLNDEQKTKWESLVESVEMPPASAGIRPPSQQ